MLRAMLYIWLVLLLLVLCLLVVGLLMLWKLLRLLMLLLLWSLWSLWMNPQSWWVCWLRSRVEHCNADRVGYGIGHCHH